MPRSVRFHAALAGALAVCLLAPASLAQRVGESLGDGVARYFASETDRQTALPSLALEAPVAPVGPEPASPLVEPVFQETGQGFPWRVLVDAPDGTSLYGTGMVPGGLLRNGRVNTCWNSDSFGWTDGTRSLYQSHPWVLGVAPDGRAFGVLADTTYRCTVDLTGDAGAEIVFVADEGPWFPVIVIEGDSPQEVVTRLSDLVGRAPLPPIWALGFHQCRYSYYPDTEMYDVAAEFRLRSIPCDVIWGDIDYLDGFRVFTFDPVGFPDPAQLDADLEAIGFKSIFTINQGIKLEPGYAAYDSGEIADVWVRTQNGVSDFVGALWPGSCKFVDFTHAAARSWWAGRVAQTFGPLGVDGVWNDMNEPTAFNTSNRSIPLSHRHRPDAAFGPAVTHDRFHNVYGMLMARSTFEGMLQAFPDRRPFVLSRANYIGGHRYSGAWTGDNNADQYNVDVTVPMVLNLGLSGQPFSGPDIGGFNGDGTAELFRQWIAIGSMIPFSRNHTGSNAQKEPWAFGTEVEDTARRALNRRYRLLPHIYTAFHEHTENGLPVARPLFFADPADPALRAVDDAFLLGPGLVVATSPGEAFACEVVGSVPDLPGELFPLAFPETNDPASPSDDADAWLPDLYVRSGHIIPTGPIIQHTDGGSPDELTLVVALDERGVATGRLYEDAGDGFAYQSGDYLLTTYRAVRDGDDVTVSPTAVEGSMARPARTMSVRLLMPDGSEVGASGPDGQPLTFSAPLGVSGAFDPVAAFVDGCSVPEAFDPGGLLATQDTPTGWGDNVNELNQLFVDLFDDRLRVGITGNMATNGMVLALFVDALPGGQTAVDTLDINPPPSGLRDLTGLVFDEGFEPETLFFMNTFQGRLFVDRVALSPGSAVKEYVGAVFVEQGNGSMDPGSNPNDMRVALSNANRAGVDEVSAGGAAGARTGFELWIPLADLGIADGACQKVRLSAVLLNSDGFTSNQWLPGVGGVFPSVGFSPDLRSIPGQQFAEYVFPVVGDLDGDDRVSLSDFGAFAALFGTAVPPDHPADLAPNGVVDLEDFGIFASNFGCVP